MIVRLEPDVDVRRAQAMATTVYANWLGEDASSKPQGAVPTLHLTPAGAGHSLLRAQYSQPLLLLTAAVLLLLLIACANIATLLMSRATARAREIAVRTAIGATRQRLVRQLMTESVFIAAIGGAFGWLVCVYFGRIMLTFLPATAEAWQFSPDRRIFASTFLVAFGSGLLFGLAPVIQVARRQVANLRSRTGTAHTARRMLDSRELLTVVQIALTIVLVTGAGLFARTLQNLRAADMGFDRDHVLLASIDPARSGYTRPRTAVFFDHLLQRLRSRGDIDAVGLASHGTLSGVLPAGTRFMSTQMHADGVTVPSTADLTVHHNVVSPGYFEASGVSLLRGRHFTELDRAENVQVAVLNQAAAHLFFGNGDPIGRRMGPGRQGPANHRSRRCRGEREVSECAGSADTNGVFAVPGRQPDDAARQDACGSTFGVARDRARVAGPGSDAAALSGADHRGARGRCAAAGTARGDAGDHLERVGHPDSRGRHLRPDQLLGCSTNA